MIIIGGPSGGCVAIADNPVKPIITKPIVTTDNWHNNPIFSAE
jgi:hypothetical protein